MKRMGVGGSIVVGGRESRLHGEGSQGIDIQWTNSRISLVNSEGAREERPLNEMK